MIARAEPESLEDHGDERVEDPERDAHGEDEEAHGDHVGDGSGLAQDGRPTARGGLGRATPGDTGT